VLDPHRLLEVGVLVAAAALQHEDVRGVHVGRGVVLREPERADGAAEAGAGDQDINTFTHGR
jgi:hypothetical protein